MQVTEEKVREIALEAMKVLGPRAKPVLVKKVVKEVVRRLRDEGGGDPSDR